MNKAACLLLLSVGALGGAFSQVATAASGPALAQAKACLACHQIADRRVGPPLAQVAARYAPGAKPETLDYLANSIREGSRGRWGAIPMPAQPHVSPAEARELAGWILALQPGS